MKIRKAGLPFRFIFGITKKAGKRKALWENAPEPEASVLGGSNVRITVDGREQDRRNCKSIA
jgi:hypothetical protein